MRKQREFIMKDKDFRYFAFFRRLGLACALIAVVVFAGAVPSAAQSLPSTRNLAEPIAGSSDAYNTTVDYVTTFYPLWFTYYQARVDDLIGTTNMMVAPKTVSPIYHFVVAINTDTLYSSVYFDLTAEPVVVTIPPNPDRVPFSTLVLDGYGNEIPAEISTTAPGVYAFTGPDFQGTLPAGVTRMPMPINYPSLYVRTVKFNALENAEKFRAALKTQTLSKYLVDPAGGATKILDEKVFAVPFKTTADTLNANTPIAFLKSLQIAVEAPNTPPMSEKERGLADRFNSLFGNGNTQLSEFRAGAQKAHELIVSNYLTKTGATNWIHFRNIGDWDPEVPADVLDRSSITQYFQLANSLSTAAYYHAFNDGAGSPLDGSNRQVYVLKFRADQIPAAKRFWSLTAYTPNTIELVRNEFDKYAVASYTPGLHYDPVDGSLTVYMSAEPPHGVPIANWLPVPEGKFNIALRVYGPDGDVASGAYVPPAVWK